MAENIDPVGGGGNALGQDPLAKQGVDEAGFSGVEFPRDHQEEEPGELLAGLLESAKVIDGDVGAETFEGRGQALEQLLLPSAHFLLPLGEDPPAGKQLADHHGLSPGAAIKSGRSVSGSDTPRPASDRRRTPPSLRRAGRRAPVKPLTGAPWR
jgi:hypothetical protein